MLEKKISPSPATFLLQKHLFALIIAVKVTALSMHKSLTQEKKFVDKNFKAGGEIGNNFPLMKISGSTVYLAVNIIFKTL